MPASSATVCATRLVRVSGFFACSIQLIAAQRPDVDADMIAHVMLGALHSEPILAQLAAEGPERLTAALHVLARAVLDAREQSRGHGRP